jgi:hypothetical protein
MPDRASRPADEALLADLAAVLAPEDVRPPESTIRALRAAVADMEPTVARRRAGAGWVRHRWAVAGGAVALLTLGTGTAFAAGVPVPPAIRILATDLGLPVTPQPVVDVRNATTSLQQTLRSASANPVIAAATAGRLAKLIQDLPPSQRAQVPAIASELLRQACRQVFPSSGGPTVTHGGNGGPTGWPGCPAVSARQGIPSGSTGRPASAATSPEPSGQGSSPGRSGASVGQPGSGGSGGQAGGGGSGHQPGGGGSGGPPPSGTTSQKSSGTPTSSHTGRGGDTSHGSGEPFGHHASSARRRP